jgi:hypothetical protein
VINARMWWVNFCEGIRATLKGMRLDMSAYGYSTVVGMRQNEIRGSDRRVMLVGVLVDLRVPRESSTTVTNPQDVPV